MSLNDLVPPEDRGKNNHLSEEKAFASEQEAGLHFETVKTRLLSPNNWGELAGDLSAEFRLFDDQMKPIDHQPDPGLYIRIDIPGPGPATGKGYDWVMIEQVQEGSEGSPQISFAGIKVIPGPHPADRSGEASHFLKEGASSTFIVRQEREKVSAHYYGRNEEANLKTGSVLTNVRNAVVALGALAGLSELQWKALLKGFIR